VRVVIADDSQLLRAGIATFVRVEGVDVVAEASSADELLVAVDEHEPDVAIVDIRMPPTQTDEGIQAAHNIRRKYPRMGIVLLSQHVEVGVATQLLAEAPQYLGYLLKDRVTDSADFVGSLRRVASRARGAPTRRRRPLEQGDRRTPRHHPGRRAEARERDLQQARPPGEPGRRPPHPRGARVHAARALTRPNRARA
jgi:DNA-binding NarL/FixJ family response regulator